jgi:hypothetical protein
MSTREMLGAPNDAAIRKWTSFSRRARGPLAYPTRKPSGKKNGDRNAHAFNLKVELVRYAALQPGDSILEKVSKRTTLPSTSMLSKL